MERARPSIAAWSRASTTTVTAWKPAKARAMSAKPAGRPGERAGGEQRGRRGQHGGDPAPAEPAHAVGEDAAGRHAGVDQEGEQRDVARRRARLGGQQRQVLVERAPDRHDGGDEQDGAAERPAAPQLVRAVADDRRERAQPGGLLGRVGARLRPARHRLGAPVLGQRRPDHGRDGADQHAGGADRLEPARGEHGRGEPGRDPRRDRPERRRPPHQPRVAVLRARRAPAPRTRAPPARPTAARPARPRARTRARTPRTTAPAPTGRNRRRSAAARARAATGARPRRPRSRSAPPARSR